MPCHLGAYCSSLVALVLFDNLFLDKVLHESMRDFFLSLIPEIAYLDDHPTVMLQQAFFRVSRKWSYFLFYD